MSAGAPTIPPIPPETPAITKRIGNVIASPLGDTIFFNSPISIEHTNNYRIQPQLIQTKKSYTTVDSKSRCGVSKIS